MRSRATTGGVRPNAKENGQIRPSNAIPDAWKAGSRPYLEVGLPTSSENAYHSGQFGGHLGESREKYESGPEFPRAITLSRAMIKNTRSRAMIKNTRKP
jgi:hypothetical protein